jgi:hypothetical protein
MTQQDCVFQIQEMLPILPEDWRLEIYNQDGDYSIQAYCFRGDRQGTEGYVHNPKELRLLCARSIDIVKIYDNGGETFDRYTIYLGDEMDGKYDCLCMSNDPLSPNGVCMHSTGQLGEHNGSEIALEDLPLIHQTILKAYDYGS